jgi:phosphoribosyl 1,2-cyclic phosphodiesterase
MRLKVISSNSSGNAYLLESSKGEVLMIECGVSFARIKQALNFNLKKVVGCLISHSHGDHCKAVKDVVAAGIRVFTSQGTIDAFAFANHWFNRVEAHKAFSVGSFDVYPFEINHDVPEPLCFLIRHEESGTILFLTDTFYCAYTFPDLNNVIVEANYCQAIIDEKVTAGLSPKFLRNRVLSSHMSIKTCKEFLLANDLSQVNNIVLIHLSDSNSDAARFKQEVEHQTGKAVHVAEPGLILQFDKTPF